MSTPEDAELIPEGVHIMHEYAGDMDLCVRCMNARSHGMHRTGVSEYETEILTMEEIPELPATRIATELKVLARVHFTGQTRALLKRAAGLLVEIDRELQEQHDELNRWQMTAEEGTVLFDEATMAIAGLAKEPLGPCCGTCIGHFGPRGRELMDKGLKYARENFAAPRPAGDPGAE